MILDTAKSISMELTETNPKLLIFVRIETSGTVKGYARYAMAYPDFGKLCMKNAIKSKFSF